MKMKLREEFDLIVQGLGTPMEPEVLARLELYAAEVVRWNKKINLTGARTEVDFIRGPLFDALSLLPVWTPAETLVDVGSGGGLPGVPLALLQQDCQISLVEPRAKRVAFLNHICHELHLPLEILPLRSEQLKNRRWQSAVAQAVWSPEEWIRRGAELVNAGGSVYVLSSHPVDGVALPTGFLLAEMKELIRPFDGAKRYSARIVR